MVKALPVSNHLPLKTCLVDKADMEATQTTCRTRMMIVRMKMVEPRASVVAKMTLKVAISSVVTVRRLILVTLHFTHISNRNIRKDLMVKRAHLPLVVADVEGREKM